MTIALARRANHGDLLARGVHLDDARLILVDIIDVARFILPHSVAKHEFVAPPAKQRTAGAQLANRAIALVPVRGTDGVHVSGTIQSQGRVRAVEGAAACAKSTQMHPLGVVALNIV